MLDFNQKTYIHRNGKTFVPQGLREDVTQGLQISMFSKGL